MKFRNLWLCFAGAITTVAQLDREQQSFYDIPIMVTDGGHRSGYSHVRVTVTDSADYTPRFKWQTYRANVYATLEEDSFVMQVCALL